jgi:hypothetical protein
MTVVVRPPAEQIAWHEAAHAAAFCHFGMVPIWARIDEPKQGLLGSVRPDWDTHELNRDTARNALIAVLMGPIFDGGLLDDWPIDKDDPRWPDGCNGDAEAARALADYLKLDHVDWLHIVWKARRLTRNLKFRRLLVNIATEFERVEVLYTTDLRKILERTT